jgi:hypothetical protein
MAYFAELDANNKVLRVISISNEVVPNPAPDNEQSGIDFIANVLNIGGTWKQTSFNANFRGKYAGIGDTYDAELDVFVAPVVEEPIIQVDEPVDEVA